MGRSDAGLSGFLGGLGSQEILELVILGSNREVCASSFQEESYMLLGYGSYGSPGDYRGAVFRNLPFLT